MQDYKGLLVWQKSYDLALKIYTLTERFPQNELYGLTSQVRRASISVPSNIAEGVGRQSDSDFARFLSISLGSAFEMECQLMLATDLNFIMKNDVEQILLEIEEVKKMLFSFTNKLRQH